MSPNDRRRGFTLRRSKAARPTRHSDLSTPSTGGLSIGLHYDPEAFGQFSEAIARTLGTARFLVIQTFVVAVWIVVNVFVAVLRWDPYPFILLNLAFSTQAAYAAPLILLAQNRQDARDRAQAETDRRVAARTQSDTEYLARELADIRLHLADTSADRELSALVGRLADSVDAATKQIEELSAEVAALRPPREDPT